MFDAWEPKSDVVAVPDVCDVCEAFVLGASLNIPVAVAPPKCCPDGWVATELLGSGWDPNLNGSDEPDSDGAWLPCCDDPAL